MKMSGPIVCFTVASVLLQLLTCLNGQIFNGNPLLEAAEMSTSIKKLDDCFCELSGPVDVCCCDVETVDSINHNKVYPLITQVVTRTFFRYFKINLNRPCPFWSDDGRCVLKDCHVEHCSEEEVPTFLKLGNDTPNSSGDAHHMSCDQSTEEEELLSTIVAISDEQQNEFEEEWSKMDDNFCHIEDDSSENGSYVDLVLNPERYTGYSGHSPHRIWSAIYNENCFRYSDLSNHYEQEQCLEKRAFYRLVSGLHSSINIHLSAQHIIPGSSSEDPKFGPNLNEFVRRFDSTLSNGQGPGWLKNLYFTYLVVLKAVVKGEEVWGGRDVFHTLDSSEDSQTREDISTLVEAVKKCDQDLFDESQLFTGDVSKQLKEEFRSHFRNISRIMDCVGCSKCRLWGTIQVQGIGTALKLLFNGEGAESGSHAHSSRYRLTRSEIVTLFNVLARLSESIEYLNSFKHMKITS